MDYTSFAQAAGKNIIPISIGILLCYLVYSQISITKKIDTRLDLDVGIDAVEKRTTLFLILVGLFTIYLSHEIHYEIMSIFLKEIGFASFVALFIRYINDRFLATRLHRVFEKQQQRIASNVMKHIFQKLIPKEVFNEIRNSILSDMKFMRTKDEIILEFTEEGGKIVINETSVYSVKSVADNHKIYSLQLGIKQSDEYSKELQHLSYKNGDEYELSEKSENVLDVEELAVEDVNKFGDPYTRYSCEIPFSQEGSISVKQKMRTAYKKKIKKDVVKVFFLIPTACVRVRVTNCPDNMKFRLSAFGSGKFVEMPSPITEKYIWEYKGCFLPNQGLIISWSVA